MGEIGGELVPAVHPVGPSSHRDIRLLPVRAVAAGGDGRAVPELDIHLIEGRKAAVPAAGGGAPESLQAAGELVELVGGQLRLPGLRAEAHIQHRGGDHGVFLQVQPEPQRVCQKAHRRRRADQHRDRRRPEGRLPVVEYVFHPLLHPRLAEGQGTGGNGAAAGAAPEQGLGVGLFDLGAQLPDHPLVAGQLNIPAQQDIGDPHQRLKPIDRQQEVGQELDPVVPAPKMGPLVGQNAGPALAVQALRQVDPGPEQPQQKGGVDLPAQPDAVSLRHGLRYTAAQPQPAHQGPEEQERHADKPERRAAGGDPPGIAHGPGDALIDVVPQVVVDRRAEEWQAAVYPGGAGVQGCLGDGLRAGDEAQGALDGEGAQQPQPHQPPQQAPCGLGGPFQRQTQDDDRQNQPSRRDTPVPEGQKQVFHITPPRTGR